MVLPVSLLFLAVVFVTSLLSGIFGMAGGLILLGFLLAWLPAAAAIAVHGVIQLSANASRAWLSRDYIDWRIVGGIAVGVGLAALALAMVRYHPSETVVLIVLGLMPILVWIPQRWFHFNVARPAHAVVCGIVSGGLTIAVGVSGPTIDIGFLRSGLDRRTVVASKAIIQVVSHALKIVFYWRAALALGSAEWGWVLLGIPLAFLGTRSGNRILARLSDGGFRTWTRWIVTVVGVYYLVRGLGGLV
ncbi:TSUP family transporter [Salinicola avicenniae]|uniref:TSUP family transporter n=1 Tax=Salinicola avicenniae TaxID=2916836 RepID=UPI002073396D|nr:MULTISPECIES: TSUP family transporter [unclassified Salinicola]